MNLVIPHLLGHSRDYTGRAVISGNSGHDKVGQRRTGYTPRSLEEWNLKKSHLGKKLGIFRFFTVSNYVDNLPHAGGLEGRVPEITLRGGDSLERLPRFRKGNDTNSYGSFQ